MIKGLDDYKKQDDSKKNKKTADSYTGGASSGLNVENPEDDDFLEKMRRENRNDPESYGKVKNKIKLTVYKNGFVLDDGEFRSIEVEANKKFMAEIEKGYIPQELVDKGMTDLGIMLEDKK